MNLDVSFIPGLGDFVGNEDLFALQVDVVPVESAQLPCRSETSKQAEGQISTGLANFIGLRAGLVIRHSSFRLIFGQFLRCLSMT